MPRLSLDDVFPAAPPHAPHTTPQRKLVGIAADADLREPGGVREEVPTKWAGIYSLELRGLQSKEIARALGMSPGGVSRITNDERYIQYREKRLATLDAEFVMMKPLAFAALKGGLESTDENTALRASEQWFKGAGFGGFAKDPVPQTRTTAEDVAAALIAGVQVNVQVNVAAEGGASATVASLSPLDGERDE